MNDFRTLGRFALDARVSDIRGMATILLVDTVGRTEAAGELLARCGHRCFQAENAWQGLAHLETADIDLCLLSLDLPGLSPLGFLRDVRRHHRPRMRDVPVIVMAAGIGAELARSLRGMQVSAMLERGGASFELLDAVRAALADREGHRWRYAKVA